jgi:hypothetical protein
MITNFINLNSEFYEYAENWHLKSFDYIKFSDIFAPETKYRITKNTEYAEPDLCEYKINSSGFRTGEFHEDTEIVAIGCSHTFGVGVPEHLIWPSVVKELTGVQDVVNLAKNGSSIAHQIRWLLNYIRIYGAPKMVLANFPDLGRYEYVSENGTLQFGCVGKGFEDNSFTINQASQQSIDAINTLEVICSTNRIVLRWQMWTSEAPYLENKFEKIFSSYVRNKHNVNYLTAQKAMLDIESNEIVGIYQSEEVGVGCCLDLKSKSNGCFNYGYDRYKVPKKYQKMEIVDSEILNKLKRTTLNFRSDGCMDAHFGSHAHYHWAKNLVDSL